MSWEVKKDRTEKLMNSEANEFRPRRDAAVAANLRAKDLDKDGN